jgi:hypothetical protein
VEKLCVKKISVAIPAGFAPDRERERRFAHHFACAAAAAA